MARGVVESRKSSTRRPSRAMAWARTPAKAGHEVVGGDGGDVAAGLGGEGAAARGEAQLAGAGAPVAAQHAPGAGPAEAVARRDEQGGRAEQDVAVDPAREVDAEEGEGRVGDGVDEAADEVAALADEAQVGAAEGDDAGIGVGAGEDGEAVGPQAGAEDGALRFDRVAVGGAQADRASGRGRRPSPRSRSAARRRPRRTSSASARQTAPKSTTAVPGACRAAMPVACGSTSRSPSASRRRMPGTPLACARRSSSSRAGSSSGRSATMSLPRRRTVDAARFAVGDHPRGAVDAQARLQRSRRVVDAAVDDAAVVRALVRGRRRLALDDEHALRWAPREQLTGDGEPEDAGADDEGVVAVVGHRSPKSPQIAAMQASAEG